MRVCVLYRAMFTLGEPLKATRDKSVAKVSHCWAYGRCNAVDDY